MITDALFKVVLYNKNYYYDSLKSADGTQPSIYPDTDVSVNVSVNPSEKALLDVVATNNNITVIELADRLNVTERTIYRTIKGLRERGLLERVGSDKNDYWKIAKR